ncbi:CopG family transcriptional regulator [Chimaeribacter californicus]|uniref:CopG family transcriptional regulator n=2 Tax=Chimaeribacter californicus TaxID=2060067 RepID=A0A2N5DTM4_9GAMM|nr:CopG family transcriptional regulator [Chimaeribacter californicus]
MSITRPVKKPPISEHDQEKFINSAPDGSEVKKKGVMKGKKQQITFTIDPEVLEKLDARSAGEGVSRAALINIAIRQLLNKGATVGGE